MTAAEQSMKDEYITHDKAEGTYKRVSGEKRSKGKCGCFKKDPET